MEEFLPVTPPTVQAGGLKGGLGGSTDLGKGGVSNGGESGESVGKDGLLARTSISSESLQSNYALSPEDWEIYKTCYLNKKRKVRKDRTSRGEHDVRGQNSGEYVEVPEWGTFAGTEGTFLMEGAEADIGMMNMLNGEENVCEGGVTVEEVKGGGEQSTGNSVECMLSQVGRTWLEPIQEEELEEEDETDEALQEAEDTDAVTVDQWQCLAAYVARIWLEALQEDGPEADEDTDVIFQKAEDADATTGVRLHCMVASEDRSQLVTIPEEGPEEEDDTDVMKTDKIKEDADAAKKIYREEEEPFSVNAEDLSGDNTEKSQKKKKMKKKIKWRLFCCLLPFGKRRKRE